MGVDLPSLKIQNGRLVRATKIAVSDVRQHSRRAITQTPGSTMVKNNTLITRITNSNHIHINKCKQITIYKFKLDSAQKGHKKLRN